MSKTVQIQDCVGKIASARPLLLSEFYNMPHYLFIKKTRPLEERLPSRYITDGRISSSCRVEKRSQKLAAQDVPAACISLKTVTQREAFFHASQDLNSGCQPPTREPTTALLMHLLSIYILQHIGVSGFYRNAISTYHIYLVPRICIHVA